VWEVRRGEVDRVPVYIQQRSQGNCDDPNAHPPRELHMMASKGRDDVIEKSSIAQSESNHPSRDLLPPTIGCMTLPLLSNAEESELGRS
jgi:hypothetical protein